MKLFENIRILIFVNMFTDLDFQNALVIYTKQTLGLEYAEHE